jgi:hypothetical protein
MKNYNILNSQGVSDIDLAETLKLDASLAGTPEINDAAFNSMFEKNVKGFMARGMSEGQARSQAGRMRKNAMKA